MKFVPKEKMCEPNHRLGNPDIKDKYCKSAEWRDEFLLMLTEVYKTIKDLKALTPPRSVSEATGEYSDDNNPVKMWLAKFYDITGKGSDRIGSAELKKQYLRDTNIEKMCDAKFKGLMDFNGITTVREKTGVFYVKLKRKEEEEPILISDDKT